MTWTIVIPCAGEGRRFGGDTPKPVALVGGRPMIEVAVESLGIDGRYVFVVRHPEVAEVVARMGEVVYVDDLLPGPAASVLAARHLIDDAPLLIANCDQRITWDPDEFRKAAEAFDGLIAVHRSSDPLFSYALVRDGLVVRTAEKDPISDLATCGAYWWSSGRMFLNAADEMVRADDRHGDEFYVAPAYNYAIASGDRVGIFEVGEMIDMGSAP